MCEISTWHADQAEVTESGAGACSQCDEPELAPIATFLALPPATLSCKLASVKPCLTTVTMAEQGWATTMNMAGLSFSSRVHAAG
jgi:hypothetical protein